MQLPNDPPVSIIIPIYKVEQYLERCLDSVVNQTLQGIEVICVDDGSPDRCGEIAEEYAKKHSNFQVIHRENGGLSAARNTGFDAATGKYVYFLDSDDYLEPEAMEELYAKAEETQAEIVSFDTRLVFESPQIQATKPAGYETAYIRSRPYAGVYSGPELANLLRILNKDWHYAVWLAFIRRDFLLRHNIRFYPGIIIEDHIYGFLCAMSADKVAFVDKIYHNYFVRPDSITTNERFNDNIAGETVCFLGMLEFLRDHPVDPQYTTLIQRWAYTVFSKACTNYRLVENAGDTPYNQLERSDAAVIFHLIERIVGKDKKLEKLKEKETALQAKKEKQKQTIEKQKQTIEKLKQDNKGLKKYNLVYQAKRLLKRIRSIPKRIFGKFKKPSP